MYKERVQLPTMAASALAIIHRHSGVFYSAPRAVDKSFSEETVIVPLIYSFELLDYPGWNLTNCHISASSYPF